MFWGTVKKYSVLYTPIHTHLYVSICECIHTECTHMHVATSISLPLFGACCRA